MSTEVLTEKRTPPDYVAYLIDLLVKSEVATLSWAMKVDIDAVEKTLKEEATP